MKQKYGKLSTLIIIVSLSISGTCAADIQWLPEGSIYPTRFLDPAACQQSLSILSYTVEDATQQFMYVPISLSMRQQFFRLENNIQQRWEWGMEFSIFTQFSIVDVGEAYLGGLQNADYRISTMLHYQSGSSSFYRFSLFHQSSHLGDDYIIRNFIVTPTPNTQNYEQLDFAVTKRFQSWGYYAGGGYNISPNTVRKRLLVHAGGDWSHPLKHQPGLALLAGVDVKVYEHNDYAPNIRVGLGFELARQTQTPLKLLFSWYQGQLPYSTLEYQKVRLVGLSLIFDVFTGV
ncbi:MAG: DUF1207 domain-containing protein [Candidatus Marinimicrobia bacterium]|nr:DUF1207 domain-containing protein [Candidatus Neomarinimicrobiota bacterium]